MFLFSIILAVLSITSYHIFQKSISPAVHPIVALFLTYSVSLVFSLFLLPFFPFKKDIISSVSEANWAVYILGIAIFGIELGYLLAYRSGWKVSLASPVSMTIATVLVVISGVLFFKEQVSPLKIVGLVLCILGVVILSQK